MKDTEIKESVRENYARIAQKEESCCGPSGCGCSGTSTARDVSRNIGYGDDDMDRVPEGANLGLGCGNPVALASLTPGETVLDLGSGAGFDCFLAAEKVGKTGRVIGLDMTPEMIDKARENAVKGDYANVEFRLGEIEKMPVADSIADVIISNCVINLVPDKPQAFRESFRVLKSGGRLMVSDIVLSRPLPPEILESVEAYVSCIAGASLKDDYLAAIKNAGFEDVDVVEETVFPVENIVSDPAAASIVKSLDIPMEKALELASTIMSIKVSARKP